MTEKLIELETAKLAKEKSFNWLTRNYFGQINAEPFETHENSLDDYNSSRWDEKGGEWISRPTQSLLQKWLREVYNIDLDIYRNVLTENYRVNEVYVNCKEINNLYDYTEEIEYKTYEEALEAGLIVGLKQIK
jgi:hypothetical protein